MQANTLERPYQREVYSFDQAELPKVILQMLVKTTPDLVVQPKTVRDVEEILQYASRKHLPVVPRGCASSALGGAVPVKAGIVLDVSSLNQIVDVDPEGLRATVGAGVRWKQLDEALTKHGLTLKTYPSSWFSTVGGWISTGGYGLNSLKFGNFKDHVRSIEFVTPSGEARTLVPEDAYFNKLFGTEGQLGVITKVTLEVRRKPKYIKAKLLQFPSEESAMVLIRNLVKAKVRPSTVIYLDPKFMHHMAQLSGRDVKEAPSVLMALEDEAEITAYSQVKEEFRDAEEAPEYLAGYFWHERLFPMRVKRIGQGLLGCEILLPLSAVGSFLKSARGLGRKTHTDLACEFHVVAGDKALVICTWFSDSRKSIMRLLHLTLVMSLQQIGMSYGGRIYSVGYWNTPLVGNRFGEEDVLQLKRAKAEADPEGTLNPGKFFELKSGSLLRLLLNSGSMRLLPKLIVALGPVTPLLTKVEDRRKPRAPPTALAEAVYGCVRCGACVSICPAYLVTSDETITGRGKLFIARKLLEGSRVSREEAQKLFLCMHCRGCQDVCQSGLRLLDAYDELEKMAEKFGKPDEEIAKFVETVEANPEYKRLIDEGVIIKAPEQGRSG